MRIELLFLAALAACGREEPFQARFEVRGRWVGERVISYRIEPENGPLAAQDFVRAVDAALAEWSATDCARFHAVSSGEEADLTFSWRRGQHGGCVPFGTDPSIAHTGPVGPGTFVHFDAERGWSVAGEPGFSLRAAALHEVGHALGLDHSPDEAALLHPEPAPERAHLSASDLAGIHSLYGGGPNGPGDLVIAASDGRVAAVLRAVAPRELCDWALFDSDGDGDQEVLVWRTDRAGGGALWSFHFQGSGSGPALERTIGPAYGLSSPEGSLSFAVAAGGERLLVLDFEDAPRQVRVFDAEGVVQLPTRELGAPPEVPPAVGPERRGDLDGDGGIESVTRRP